MNIHDMENLLLSEMETVTGGVTGGTCICTSAAYQEAPPKCLCSTGALISGIVKPPVCGAGFKTTGDETCVCSSGAIITS